ncbi:uncharacterized protein N0V89_009589 [Didymosphaeria variabile]|uniref:FHA domain-containing protein n=1 Tax=Didymosphaeria variabile TaxID=1932322 RepID=A0A9W8XDT0_9PLEO|nr:uncharacterized protein N0V89_009589 [Didymosphaeria variabile]KAJ4348217.1 hypothetical protein N0V89_009589 [Didymosphaeria variabile]
MPERELSPYSARVALTQKLQQGQGSQSAPAEHKSRPWDTRGPPPERRQNGHDQSPMQQKGRGRGGRLSPPSDGSSGVREKSKPSPPRSVRDGSPEDRSQKAKSKDPSIEPELAARQREASPEPYRKPREASRERERHRSRHRDRSKDRHNRRDRHRSRDRDRTKDRDRSRGRDKSKGRDRSRDLHREKHRERSGERKRDGSRERKRSRGHETKRERSRDRYRDRPHSRDRNRDQQRHRDRSKDRRSRSPRSNRAAKRSSPSSSPPPKRRRKRTPSPRALPLPTPLQPPLPDQEVSFRGSDNSALPPTKYGGAPPNLEKPNFKPTGLLAKAANKVEGTKISLKYHEPPEARKPPSSQAWKVIVFKGEDVVDTIELGVKSCWLLGREVKVVDYVLEHPSSSGQHAVIQFRYVTKTVQDEYGVKKTKGKVKPYVIDLESSNGTELNGERVETSRYFELRDKDILKFAGSEREYVVVLPPPEERKE